MSSLGGVSDKVSDKGLSIPKRQRTGAVQGSLGNVTLYAVGPRRWEVRAWHLEESNVDGRLKFRRIWQRRTFQGKGKKIAAQLWADELRAQLANGAAALRKRSPLLALKDQELRERCARMNTSPEAVVEAFELKWKEGLRIAGPSGCKVADLVDKFLDAKRAEGVTANTLANITGGLRRFAKDFSMAMAEVTPELVQQWLDAQGVGPRTWNNYLAPIKALGKWGVQWRWLPADWSLGTIANRKVPWEKPETFSAGELRWMLEQAEQPVRRCLALGALAGLRTVEIWRIDWAAFKWEEGHIHVSKSIAKTRQHNPPILDCLRPWLGTVEERGRFCPYKSAEVLSGTFCDLGAAAGASWAAHWREKRLADPKIVAPPPLAWRSNGHRKSWISNRLAMIGNEVQVADEAGTSLSNIHRNYLDRPPLSEARKYFSIRPGFDVPQNVVQLQLGVA